MLKQLVPFIVMCFVGLLVVTSFVYFNSTEAYLNGLSYYQEDDRDFDRDGKKNASHHASTHMVQEMQLNHTKIKEGVIVVLQLFIQEPDFAFVQKNIPFDFKLSILRPPIRA